MLVGEVWVEGYCIEEDECCEGGKSGKQVAKSELRCSSNIFEDQDGNVGGSDGDAEDAVEGENDARDAADGLESVTDKPKMRRGQANRKLGKRGEDAAARYLRFMGYQILERNWECPFGEADIIARDGETLVFIEVKTRKSIRKGFPAEAVTPKKRARYERIAACYLRTYGSLDIPMRFDVIALLVVGPDRAMIKHYVDAFRFE